MKGQPHALPKGKSVVKRIVLLLGFTVASAYAAPAQVPQTHALVESPSPQAGVGMGAFSSQTLQPVSSTAVQIYPAAVEASLPSAEMGSAPVMGSVASLNSAGASSSTSSPATGSPLQAPPPMGASSTPQPAPFAYGNRDLCGLQTLLVIEAMQQDRIKPHMSFDKFNTDIIRRFFSSRVLDNLSDDKKVYFINLIHQNAQAAYAQGWKRLPANTAIQRDNSLKTLMWQQCDADLSHP